MASSFHHWEKDPFFAVAEEVQDSADRMESTYRTWIQSKKYSSGMWDLDELRRDLHASVGTTKWQLEEFGRAVRSSYVRNSSDSSRDRHRDFIVAIQDQVKKIEDSLLQSEVSDDNSSLPWGRLDEGECSELALFLSAPSTTNEENVVKEHKTNVGNLPPKMISVHQSSHASTEVGSLESKEDKAHGHRRTASASADIESWKISVSDDVKQWNASNPPPSPPVRKITSFSGSLNTMESVPKKKWPRMGFRKSKATDHHQEEIGAPLQSSQPTGGIDDYYERSRSCLENCDECYVKQLDGWHGAMQRQLQRSQYQMQYSRPPAKLTFLVVVFLCLIVFMTFRAL